MKKLICLLCICLLLVGGVFAALAEDSHLSDSGQEREPESPGTSPDGGDDGGVGGGGGWPK